MPFDPAAADAFAGSFARDSAFDQLLRLAASYSSSRPAAGQAGARKSPLMEDIERRAYELYLSRGGTHGNDMDDWLQAERQVLDELKSKKASLRLALAFGLLKAPLE